MAETPDVDQAVLDAAWAVFIGAFGDDPTTTTTIDAHFHRSLLDAAVTAAYDVIVQSISDRAVEAIDQAHLSGDRGDLEHAKMQWWWAMAEKRQTDLRAVRRRVRDIATVVRRNVHYTQRKKTLLQDVETAYAELEQLRRNPCSEVAGRGEFWLGDIVRVILEGKLESYDPELGHYRLRGNTRGALHIPWEHTLHWATDFIVLEPGPRKEEPPNA